jgi:sugar phosphate isomerase/epimerase
VIDVSCFVGPGPLVPPRFSTPAAVEAHLRRAGVTRAAVSPMAGLFDLATYDVRRRTSFFCWVPIVGPTCSSDRLASYRRGGSPAVRISPGSHGYRAADAAGLARTCGALGLTLILQMRVADPRNLPADLTLSEVAAEDATALARSAPETSMIVAGARVGEISAILGESPDRVLADVSLAEEPDVLRRAVAAHGAHRLVIGTHAPFLTPVAAARKLAAARLAPDDHAAVSRRNAERLGF